MCIDCLPNPCPINLNASCVFYQGANLPYTGILTNDNYEKITQKLEAILQNIGVAPYKVYTVILDEDVNGDFRIIELENIIGTITIINTGQGQWDITSSNLFTDNKTMTSINGYYTTNHFLGTTCINSSLIKLNSQFISYAPLINVSLEIRVYN